ncbi:hydrogenobyrinic acid a,c-diamide synthase (glutamine-hydrolyzing) [Maritalea myrionectae]|uniref:Hydrogenobyrinate a,c-diamide synthase n=1 Tax=Maritalea myrionectae TaxID=454601 RepID=A0A2R4MHZ8_9HYPH|nr:cobyrinate a,c-diamide synthase [Maritalea myrionectae]AVX05651.1 hydrogenobyrinic acid a,c-diamide synthase (glutamine-hydrolyzing) [Maritalea myrionectae]
MAKGLIIAATQSGSGKTLLTTALLGALKERGMQVASAKTGPDYIDGQVHGLATGQSAINLDPWAMSQSRQRSLLSQQASGQDLVLVEGVMGLFDGSASGKGSTADLARNLQLPVVLVVDCGSMAQSIAALVYGFQNLRTDIDVAGVILNRVASDKHEKMLKSALAKLDIEVLGALRRNAELDIPSRHLGLTLPEDFAKSRTVAALAISEVKKRLDLDGLLQLAKPILATQSGPKLAPLGQKIAIASDAAFAFLYPHLLADWQAQGAQLHFFSPLADEAPADDADAVFLPGGYPELHGALLANAQHFKQGMHQAAERNALIYGECGGYMVLGESLTDKSGNHFEMTGLLPLQTAINRPRRQLGYRRLSHKSILPWPSDLLGHEFHYSTELKREGDALFRASDAEANAVGQMGLHRNRILGSYAHIIDVRE